MNRFKYLSKQLITPSALFAALFLAFLPSCETVPETNRTQLILLDQRTEFSMGTKAYKDILKKSKISPDKRLTKIIRRVGRRIAKVVNRPQYKWEFNLVEDKTPNAYCLPGGKVGVHTGILPIAKNEAGLAAVIGHEIAHAVARHGAERMSQSIIVALAGEVMAQGLTQNEADRQAMRAAYGIGSAVAITLPFSRNHELEADYLGILYMARAGYDPREAKKFWQRFSRWGKKEKKSNNFDFLSTHPANKKRIAQIDDMLARAMAEYNRSAKIGAGEDLKVSGRQRKQ